MILAALGLQLSRSSSRHFDVAATLPCLGAIDAFECTETPQRLHPVDVRAADHLHIRGWSCASDPLARFERYVVVIDDTKIVPIQYGMTRPDVAAAYGSSVITKCGFDVSVSVIDFDAGEHRLLLAGAIGNRWYCFAQPMTFRVLARPTLIGEPLPRTDLPGRVREIGESHADSRSDGRSARAIRAFASLSIRGWLAGSADGTPADALAVVLIGNTRRYRIPAQSTFEPEAGVNLGPKAVACGYHAFAAACDFEPGVYTVDIEVTRAGVKRFVATGEYVEIMNSTGSWLPSALPMYYDSLSATFDPPLPTSLSRRGTMIVSGQIIAQEPIGGIFARIDDERTYELTSQSDGSRNDTISSGGRTIRFGGLLAIDLPEGSHAIEIVALDPQRAGVWRMKRYAFDVVEAQLGVSAGED